MKVPKAKDPRGAHARLYWEILDSPAWASLTACDQRAYMVMLRQLLSFNNGDISLPFSRARHAGITNEATLAKSLRALRAVGLIAITHKEAHRRDGSRLPNLYRFTDYPVYSMPGKHVEASPATNEWRSIQSKQHGRAEIRKMENANAAEREKERAVRAARSVGKK